MSHPVNLTISRLRLASTLRHLRERSGTSAAEAARRVDHDASWLSRIETAEVRPHPNDVRALLHVYQIDDAPAEAVISMARQAKRRGWWQRYRDVLPPWFTTYVGMESEASRIRTYECQAVPGLLQTEQYARATFSDAPQPPAADERERRVALRLARQAIFDDPQPPRLEVVIDEGAARRQVGGAATMRAQLSHLIEQSHRPELSLRLLPHRAGVGFDGSFVILDFPPPPEVFPVESDDRMVYVDTLTGALYLERPEEVDRYVRAHQQVTAQSLDPSATRDALHALVTAGP